MPAPKSARASVAPRVQAKRTDKPSPRPSITVRPRIDIFKQGKRWEWLYVPKDPRSKMRGSSGTYARKDGAIRGAQRAYPGVLTAVLY